MHQNHYILNFCVPISSFNSQSIPRGHSLPHPHTNIHTNIQCHIFIHIKVCLRPGPAVEPDNRDTNPFPYSTEKVSKFIRTFFKGVSHTPSIFEACMFTVGIYHACGLCNMITRSGMPCMVEYTYTNNFCLVTVIISYTCI